MNCYRIKSDKSGFTLIELLAAMILLSMVTLVVTLALKLAIDSWERGSEEGEDIQCRVAIPSLMSKQLDSLAKTDPFDSLDVKQPLFWGQKHAFEFYTSHAPQGSPWQGLLKVTYLFKEEEKTLYIFEQVITKKEDIKDEFDPLSDKWDNAFEPISQVHGVTVFDLTYTGQKRQDPYEADGWVEIWKGTSPSLPTGLGLRLRVGTGPNAETRNFYFRLGNGLAL